MRAQIERYTLTQEQVAQLESVSNVVRWCDSVYATLTRSRKGTLVLPFRKWLKVVSRYYVDILNESPLSGSRGDQEIYRDLVAQTSIKLSAEEDVVETAFEEGRFPLYPALDISAVTNRIPTSITERLIAQQGEEEFVSLALRYHVPLLTEGLFLSMPPRMYVMLAESSELPFLEGYGSPLNNNCPEYCSLFPQDGEYGALPRYDEYLPVLNFPVRLCVNPPYTPRAIKRCVDVTLEYMERVRGEFIMLLPIMYGFEPLDRVLSYRNTCHCLMEQGEYTVYSFFTERSICPPMSLYLIVNVRNSKSKSQALLNSTRELLSEGAKLLWRSARPYERHSL